MSWYEAVAFCQWLSEEVGEQIMLPTEQQWQRAAQDDHNRVYPWGNDWDQTLCNNNVDQKGIGKTSSVTQYEGKGDSPFGVVDMVGNVWEWCLTEYKSGNEEVDGTNARVSRGCSWLSDSRFLFGCVVRNRMNPTIWHVSKGFRVVSSHIYP
jgi:formylglycine-generating enzyme required for sulfatase activity